MLLPLLRSVAFTLAPVLVLIWSTFPDLLRWIASSAYQIGDNPSKLFHLWENLPSQVQGLLVGDENVVKSLTCDNIDLFSSELVLKALTQEIPHASMSSL
ncbi:hypothetical protein DSO57_1017626 [Entomophthora muscae]|uniref:Uncharacterized protein n=1 Tax=Entomophthora muscae TaxID=34485 RepID=A0ACC2RVM4_9FUNG|nr:hypothetical protein DSO57_1017626 [Entomophthora muscae]